MSDPRDPRGRRPHQADGPAPPRIPLEDFFRKPEHIGVRLSPDGRRIAYKKPWERRLNIHVRDLATCAESRVTSSTVRDVGGHAWVNNDRIIYEQDTGGDENHRLHAVGGDGSNPLDLTTWEWVKCGMVDELEDDDDAILFAMNRRDPRIFDVHRLDIHTGAMTLVAENPGNVQHWITDHEGRLRLATTTDGVNKGILYRASETDDWKEVARYSFKEGASPVAFTFDDPSCAWVISNLGRDRLALCIYDLRTGHERGVLFENADVDISGLLYSRHRKTLTGASYITEKPRYEFFDETMRRIHAFLDERLPGYEHRLVSHSRDETRWVVYHGSDRTLGGYHLLDTAPRPSRGDMSLVPLFELSPWLDERHMAPVKPIAYTADDGLRIPGYLTLPVGRGAGPFPMVVHPHGGPWTRDVWGFDPEVQFLANRGYAVLQMNYRGSAGYGRRFLEAGFGQWGLAMQDDITAGVRWAIEEKIADPARVAIYGGSYGGYAALAGLTKTPDLYACGVSYVGVSNLFTWFEAIPPYWKLYLEMMHEMVGDPVRDRDRMQATSPLFNAGRIRVPLFVAQGANDPRVRREESDQIVAALRQRGVPVEYMVKENEGHGFSNEENRFDFYRALEAFLARHLGKGT